jgi:hypothetical protein
MLVSEAYIAGVFCVLLFLVLRTPCYLVVLMGQKTEALTVLTKGVVKAKEILGDIVGSSKEETEKLFVYGVTVVVYRYPPLHLPLLRYQTKHKIVNNGDER